VGAQRFWLIDELNAMSRHVRATVVLCAALTLLYSGRSYPEDSPINSAHFIVEAYPASIQARIKARDRELRHAASAVVAAPKYVIVPTIQRWTPGYTLRVAFEGGNPNLYAKIEKAVEEWTKPGIANLTLVFKNKRGHYLTWRPSDTHYKAEIRVAFLSGRGQGGYWSAVGKDSIDPAITSPGKPSLNLEGFDKTLPDDWQAIVLHEFGHALGFQHEHQSPSVSCDFRFEDDPGYIKTKDADGWYVRDAAGRRPGLYTYLGGYPDYWCKRKVDDNLRTLPNSSAFLIGPFDKESIMKYFFDASMFEAGEDSPCWTQTENLELSQQDRLGAHTVYPTDPATINALVARQRQILQQLVGSTGISDAVRASLKLQLESLGDSATR
jgi:hypothetical protein